MPAYQQVAVAFAGMHDTPVRMIAKGVVKDIVPWEDARRVLATRLRRRWAASLRELCSTFALCWCFGSESKSHGLSVQAKLACMFPLIAHALHSALCKALQSEGCVACGQALQE